MKSTSLLHNVLQHLLSNALIGIIVLTLAVSGCLGCDVSHSADAPRRATSDDIALVPFFIETADRTAPVDPATPLYEARAHQPIRTPEGAPVTLNAFARPRGVVSVSCGEDGFTTTIDLSGLIPGAVYTIWHATFAAPGMDVAHPEFNRIGLGALGTPDGAASRFVANEDGRGFITAFTPAGPLSTSGEIAACPLTDEAEWHVVGAYHLDGQTHGGTPGPDGTVVEQFRFAFRSTL